MAQIELLISTLMYQISLPACLCCAGRCVKGTIKKSEIRTFPHVSFPFYYDLPVPDQCTLCRRRVQPFLDFFFSTLFFGQGPQALPLSFPLGLFGFPAFQSGTMWRREQVFSCHEHVSPPITVRQAPRVPLAHALLRLDPVAHPSSEQIVADGPTTSLSFSSHLVTLGHRATTLLKAQRDGAALCQEADLP